MTAPAKIIYLTAEPVATSAELAEIATLQDIAAQDYEVIVQCGKPVALLTGITLSAAASDNSYNDSGATITAGTISASSVDNSLNDSGNGFLTAGFQVGDVLTIAGFTGDTNNNTSSTARVVTAAAGKLVLSNVTLVSDSAGESVTVSAPGRFLARGFKVGMPVFVRGFTGDTANNIDSGVITSVTATKMIIGGTDGDVIVDDAAGESVTISSVETLAKYGTVAVPGDYLAGTVTEAYKSSGSAIYTVFSPSNPPDVPGLIATQAIVSDGETVVLKTNAGGTSDDTTATVAAHAVTVALPATKTVAAHGDTVAVGSDNVTLTVSAGVIASGSIGATKTIVENNDTLNLTTAGTVTFGVSGGTLSGDIAATTAVVANGATVAVGSGTATLTVTARALASAALDATHAVVADTQELAITSGSGTTKVTLTIAGGAITAVVLS